MFKKIQNYLLLHRPLLWNVRILPLLVVVLSLHVIFFVVGYLNGAVDFSEANEGYHYNGIETAGIFFGILLSILITVLWLVFYFRNNAFKSYYPKKRSSLYQEWLLVLVVCLVNCSYPLTLMYGQDLRARNYFTEQEFNRRTDIISMASLFADGSFQESGDSIVDKPDGTTMQVHHDTFKYKNKIYPLNSLLNKGVTDFSTQKFRENEGRVKGWLINNRKDSVLWVMTEFEKIARDHHAESNITPQKWLDLVYHYPEFDNYVTVGRTYSYESDDYMRPAGNEETVAVADNNERLRDTVSNVIKVRNGRTYVYPKYYVSIRQVENAYSKIADAWSNPNANPDMLLIYAFMGLMFSLVVFSFRVTSGRSWLIALVSFGIMALVTGVVNILLLETVLRETTIRLYGEYLYFGFWLIIVAGLLGYFFTAKKVKRFSDIVLNVLLWLIPWVIPVIGMLVKTYIKSTVVYVDGKRVSPVTGLETFLSDYQEVFMALCILVFICFMYFFTASIKRWKGIAEA